MVKLLKFKNNFYWRLLLADSALEQYIPFFLICTELCQENYSEKIDEDVSIFIQVQSGGG